MQAANNDDDVDSDDKGAEEADTAATCIEGLHVHLYWPEIGQTFTSYFREFVFAKKRARTTTFK